MFITRADENDVWPLLRLNYPRCPFGKLWPELWEKGRANVLVATQHSCRYSKLSHSAQVEDGSRWTMWSWGAILYASKSQTKVNREFNPDGTERVGKGNFQVEFWQDNNWFSSEPSKLSNVKVFWQRKPEGHLRVPSKWEHLLSVTSEALVYKDSWN